MNEMSGKSTDQPFIDFKQRANRADKQKLARVKRNLRLF
jgi:hypothetical protein